MPEAQRTAYCEFFPAQTPAEGEIRTLLATRMTQSVRGADFGRVSLHTHTRHYNFIIEVNSQWEIKKFYSHKVIVKN